MSSRQAYGPESEPILGGGNGRGNYKARVENLKSALRKWVTINEQRSMALQNSADQSEKIRSSSNVQKKLMGEINQSIQQTNEKLDETEDLVKQQKEALDKAESLGIGSYISYFFVLVLIAGGVYAAWKLGVFSGNTSGNGQSDSLPTIFHFNGLTGSTPPPAPPPGPRSTRSKASRASLSPSPPQLGDYAGFAPNAAALFMDTASVGSFHSTAVDDDFLQESGEPTRHQQKQQTPHQGGKVALQAAAEQDFEGFLPVEEESQLHAPTNTKEYEELMPNFGDGFLDNTGFSRDDPLADPAGPLYSD